MLEVIGVLIMIGGLLIIPIGLPGLWVIVAVIAAGAIAGVVGPFTVIGAIIVAGIAELLEFLFVKRMTARYGGSNRAFWGALVGGIVGVFVGLPVPVIGSMIAGFVGSFVGAAVVAYAETRELLAAHRVGWGVLVGRIMSAFAKTAAGVVLLVWGISALLF